MSRSLGDRSPGATIDFKFMTHVNGVPTTLSGSPVISIYKDNSTTQTTTGVTLTADFDGVTGLNNVRVAMTDSFYTAGSNFQAVITTGTVGGNSVVGAPVADFSLGLTDALARSMGLQAQGTLSGTHSSTTADLGTNAPASDIAGMTLFIPGKVFTRLIDSYNTGTGVATFASTGATLENGDQWYLLATPQASAANPIPANAVQIEGVDATDQLDAHAAAGATPEEIWEYETRSLTDKAGFGLADGAITAAKTASDYVTEMQGAAAAAIAAYDPPTNAEMTARTLASADYATAAGQAAIEGKVDAVDSVADGIKATTDKLDDTLEDQGGGTYGFTAAALQEAPTGSGATAQEVWEYEQRGLTERVNANITHVIDDPVQQNGASDTNWGGAT